MDGTKIAPPRTVGFWGTALFPLNGMIGAGIFAPRVPTRMFNGYGEQVAALYAGMDLKRLF